MTFQKGQVGFWKNKKFSKKHLENMSISHIGNSGYWTGKKRSPELMKRLAYLSSQRRGSLNPMWKGGITPISHLIRATRWYKEWRQSVYQRDSYTCQCCGYKGKDIVAHHCYPFSQYPEFRFEVNNGITLCRECHPHIEAIT